MSAYGKMLKKLIDFSSVKMYVAAETVGYDVSYISKWCNKDYLPSVKASSQINQKLSAFLSKEILEHRDPVQFSGTFGVQAAAEDLESVIFGLLQDSYEKSDVKGKKEKEPESAAPETGGILIHNSDILLYLQKDFPELVNTQEGPIEILCTLDVCLFLEHVLPNIPLPKDREVDISIAVDKEKLFRDKEQLFPKLYMYLSTHSSVSFSLCSNEKLKQANIILVQNRVCLLCSQDDKGKIITMSTVTDQIPVRHIYSKLKSLFTHSEILLHVSDPLEFHRKGYRTDFYAKNNFQILLAHGFEYLLPRDCWQGVIDTAMRQFNNETIALLVRRLEITWDEIFEHGSIDFFVLKTSLIRYMETGEIIFTDVVHCLTPQERKSHIQHVLNITAKNPNIAFYLIDDEKFEEKNKLFYMSVFSNRSKAFIKNPNRYHHDCGPFFYSILSDDMIGQMTDYFDWLKNSHYCKRYTHEELSAFYNKYSTLINRMIDLKRD